MADEKYLLAYTGAQTDTLLGDENTTAMRVTSHVANESWEITTWSNGRVEMLKRVTLDLAMTTACADASGFYTTADAINVTLPTGTISTIMNISVELVQPKTRLVRPQITSFSSQNAYFAWAPISSKSISATGVIGFYRVVGWNV